MATGMRSSNCTSEYWCTISATGAPLNLASPDHTKRAIAVSCRFSASVSISLAGTPEARRQPTKAPTDAPTIKSGFRPSSSRAFQHAHMHEAAWPARTQHPGDAHRAAKRLARGASGPLWIGVWGQRATGRRRCSRPEPRSAMHGRRLSTPVSRCVWCRSSNWHTGDVGQHPRHRHGRQVHVRIARFGHRPAEGGAGASIPLVQIQGVGATRNGARHSGGCPAI